MDISITVMAHPDRTNEATALLNKLLKMPFIDVYVVIDQQFDEWENGKKAWNMHHPDSDWHVVIQDDAIIGDTFYNNLTNALLHVPEPTLVSLYTGTVRPKPTQVKRSVQYAKDNKVSWLTDKGLHWGVCFAMPTQLIDTVLKDVDMLTLNYDNRIGYYFKRRSRNIYYAMPSLVDHNDDLPSLIGHDLSTDKRVAHWFVGDEVMTWNKRTKEIK